MVCRNEMRRTMELAIRQDIAFNTVTDSLQLLLYDWISVQNVKYCRTKMECVVGINRCWDNKTWCSLQRRLGWMKIGSFLIEIWPEIVALIRMMMLLLGCKYEWFFSVRMMTTSHWHYSVDYQEICMRSPSSLVQWSKWLASGKYIQIYMHALLRSYTLLKRSFFVRRDIGRIL